MSTKTKKDEGRFNIKFCLADPRHKRAVDALNLAGRRKAYLVADAISYYLARGGEYRVGFDGGLSEGGGGSGGNGSDGSDGVLGESYTADHADQKSSLLPNYTPSIHAHTHTHTQAPISHSESSGGIDGGGIVCGIVADEVVTTIKSDNNNNPPSNSAIVKSAFDEDMRQTILEGLSMLNGD